MNPMLTIVIIIMVVIAIIGGIAAISMKAAETILIILGVGMGTLFLLILLKAIIDAIKRASKKK